MGLRDLIEHIIAGQKRLGIYLEPPPDQIEDGVIQGLQNRAVQVLPGQAANLLHAGKASAGLDVVGQKDHLFQERHPRAPRGVGANRLQHLFVVDAQPLPHRLGADGSVPQHRAVLQQFPGQAVTEDPLLQLFLRPKFSIIVKNGRDLRLLGVGPRSPGQLHRRLHHPQRVFPPGCGHLTPGRFH